MWARVRRALSARSFTTRERSKLTELMPKAFTLPLLQPLPAWCRSQQIRSAVFAGSRGEGESARRQCRSRCASRRRGQVLFVPERKSLVSQEGRDAAYKLLT